MAAPAARPDSNPLFSDAAARLLSPRRLLELITSPKGESQYAVSVSAHMPASFHSSAYPSSGSQKRSQASHLSSQ